MQAWSDSVGNRLWRRQAPHCMGSLIWQLNDTWAGTTRAVLNFDGTWKSAMYEAKRDFAPVVAMAYVPDGARDKAFTGWKGDRRPVRLTVVSDRPEPQAATVTWSVRKVADGAKVARGSAEVKTVPNGAASPADLDLTDVCKANGDAAVYLRYALTVDRKPAGGDTFWFADPKSVELPRLAVTRTVKQAGPRAFDVTFSSPAVQFRYGFELPGIDHRASDNSFDLYPNEPRTVRVTAATDHTAAEVDGAMTGGSLADTYAG